MKVIYSMIQQLEHIVRNHTDDTIIVEISTDELSQLFVELVVTGNEYLFGMCYKNTDGWRDTPKYHQLGSPEYEQVVSEVKNQLAMINNYTAFHTLEMEDIDTLATLRTFARSCIIRPHCGWYTYKNVVMHLVHDNNQPI